MLRNNRLRIPIVFLALLLLFVMVATAAPEPTYGPATVDGDPGEWDLTNDFFADMYESADSTNPANSRLYLRYDCEAGVLYALVLPADSLQIKTDVALDEHYVKLGNSTKLVDGNDSPPDAAEPNFSFINDSGTAADGWEASASLAVGSYTNLNVHTIVTTNGTDSQGSAVDGNAIAIDIVCSPSNIDLQSSAAGTSFPTGWLLTFAGILAVTILIVVFRRRQPRDSR
jgi:hypothetical protein